ncbi:MAG: hypothetical protein BGO86_10415 [Chryseobacterium sp. 36-9]|nr:MAG: hypothetical protein BGO86_10415 [Chryseobacterium sp. 36-9]
MRTEILKLKEMDRMPDESGNDDESTNLLVEKYNQLLTTIQKPINIEEGKALISLFPETAFYDLQWDLLQLVESLYGNIDDKSYINIINECPSAEWKEALLNRYRNGSK